MDYLQEGFAKKRKMNKITRQGKTAATIALIIVIMFILTVISATGDLTCWIEDSATCTIGQGTELLRMKNDTGGHDNAHAQEVNYTTPYTHVLCCNSTNNVITNSSGTAFLNLSADTNAHAQAFNGTTTAYFIPAYISGGSTNIICDTYITGCPTGYTCLVSMASDGPDNTTNAHVSSCDVYDTEICCNGTTMNSPPNTVTLHEPFNGNATLFNRTITFQWLNTTDPDGDSITYGIQVKQCGTSNPSTCNPDVEFDDTFLEEGEINVTGITEGTNLTEYISMLEVLTDQNYTWRARAYDGIDYGGWSENWTFYVPSTVMLTVLDSEMSFGELNLNEVNDTTDNEPFPFRVRNEGNVLTDISVNITSTQDWLWFMHQEASQYFQYKIDNATSDAGKGYDDESGAFNSSASVIDLVNMPETNTSANIRQLNYSDVTDEVEIDIKITVPSDEPAGNKSSTVSITGWVSI